MTNREQLLCLTVFSAFVLASQVARADEYAMNDVASAEVAEPMTCSQAIAFAWFKHELERTDGANDSGNVVDRPAECSPTYLAQSPEEYENNIK